jgi:hypothetical protein
MHGAVLHGNLTSGSFGNPEQFHFEIAPAAARADARRRKRNLFALLTPERA